MPLRCLLGSWEVLVMNARHLGCALAVAALAFASAGCDDSSTGSTTTSSGGVDDCAPQGAGCPTVATDCVGLVDNAGKANFALRIAHLTIEKPEVLTEAAVKGLLNDGVQINLGSCQSSQANNLFPTGASTGAFSWILQFDTASNMLTTGGALPAEDPMGGYCFVNDTISGFPIKPLTVASTIGADGSFEITTPADVVVPVYSDRMKSSVILLPLKSVKISMAKLSDNNNCIGTYNGAALGDNFCIGSDSAPAFIDSASLDGFVTLEDADNVTVTQLNKSLCVILAKDAKFADMTGAKCARDAMNAITFPGDWCSTTNMAADATCHDAMKLQGKFAAALSR